MQKFALKLGSLGIAVLMLAVAPGMSTASAQEPSSAGCRDPKLKPSKFKRWVRPSYPEASLAAGRTGVVEVHVDVDEGGKPSAIKMGSAPQSDEFEHAVMSVLEHWRYIVPINKACEPLPSRVQARVHFSVEDGKPTVSLEEISQPNSGKACVDALHVLNEGEIREKLAQNFPRVARRSGSEGVVYLAITASAATGETKDVEVVHLVEGGSAKREFRNAAMLAFRDMRVEARPGANMDETVRICRSVRFELTD